MSACPNHLRARRLATSLALVIVLASAVGGCNTTQNEPPPTAAMASANTDTDWRLQANTWGERYRANPNDATAAINYAQALRKLGQRSQALAVLEQASIAHPKNMELLGAFGRALADAGSYQQALDVLKDRKSTRLNSSDLVISYAV